MISQRGERWCCGHKAVSAGPREGVVKLSVSKQGRTECTETV